MNSSAGLTRGVICLALGLTPAWAPPAWGCEENSGVRPLGSDHLLYTIERGAEDDAPSLNGRKFRLIVNDPDATGLNLMPAEAFHVQEVSRFSGNVTFSAEIKNASALYKSESWGRLPRPLTFTVDCGEGTSIGSGLQTASVQSQPTNPTTLPGPAFVVASSPAEPVVAADKMRVVAETPESQRVHLQIAANAGEVVTQAYPQGQLKSAPLPPLPESETGSKTSANAATKARPVVRAAAQARIGEPSSPLSPSELLKLELQLRSGAEQKADGGKTRLSYELILRNPLTRSIQCDVEVQSFYPKSFGSRDVVAIDTQTHEGVQIRSRGYRTGVTGEILHMPNVLGGKNWMKHTPVDPNRGGLRLQNCFALKS